MINGLKFSAFAGAIAACALVSGAQAANLVQNGSFTDNTISGPLNPANASGVEFDGNWNYPNTVTGWSTTNLPGSSAFDIYFFGPNANTITADTRYTGGEPQHLNSNFTGLSPDGGAFIGLDGELSVAGNVEQMISGLAVGKEYQLSFYWAGAELSDRTGYQSITLQGSFGADSFSTPTYLNTANSGDPGSFSGWQLETFTFTAQSASQLLQFVSVGTPNANVPPFALLDGVSITAVPEASTWGMILLGFAGLGLAAKVRRRRAIALVD